MQRCLRGNHWKSQVTYTLAPPSKSSKKDLTSGFPTKDVMFLVVTVRWGGEPNIYCMFDVFNEPMVQSCHNGKQYNTTLLMEKSFG